MSESPLPQNKALQESDLVALIAVAARENRFIEFKSEYLLNTDGGRKKFLQTVSAFANSHGGDLILGMAESNGVASFLSPLTDLNTDQCRLQIHDLIRVHLHPTLGGVKVEAVPITAGGHVLVVRVAKSWVGPHILKYNDDRRFYIRDDAGKKRPMEYEEVRDGFLLGETTGARLRNYRMERCAAILNDDVPGPLLQRQRIVLHLLPFEMFAKPRRFEVRDLYQKCDDLLPIDCSGYSRAFDLDGFYCHGSTPDRKVYGYAYLFRSGAIEAVDAQMLPDANQPEHQAIPYGNIEPKIIGAVEGYLKIFKALEISPPYACCLSLLNVRGYFMPTGFRRIGGGQRITRDHLYIAESIFDPAPDSVAAAMYPIFNSVWNACDFPQSLNYSDTGNWNPR